MYGLGFTVRSPRYRLNGSMPSSADHLWDGTTWKMSPACAYSMMRDTMPSNCSRGMFDRKSTLSLGSRTPKSGTGPASSRRAFSIVASASA
jgi:hypothetical protein